MINTAYTFTQVSFCFHSLISSLRIRILTETQPDTRLHRILHKKRFDEAKNFAEQFNLDVEVSNSVNLILTNRTFSVGINQRAFQASFLHLRVNSS